MTSYRLLLLLGVLASVQLPAATGDWREAYRRPATTATSAVDPAQHAQIELGRLLFFDPRLSGSGAISCATCHNPALGWSDGLPVARGEGHRPLERRTPTVLNAAYNPVQMWDGRFATLEEQAAGPMTSPVEMNVHPEVAIARLRTVPHYRELFQAAFGDAGISMDTITRAIAAFERTLVSGHSPFDRYVEGDDAAISPAARRGFALFNTKAACASCHSGWNFSDGSFHDIGVVGHDPGRGAILGIELMNHAFKTPTLRDIAQRPPYMHNGSEPTLRSVIELYNQGGRSKRPTRSDVIKPLNLTSSEVDDLIAFLRTLTGAPLHVAIPQLPVSDEEPPLEASPASRTKSERVASTLARKDAPE